MEERDGLFDGKHYWQWGTYSEDEVKYLRRPFGFVVRPDSNGNVKPLGNVAFIYSGKENCLAISVRHIFESKEKAHQKHTGRRLGHLFGGEADELRVEHGEFKVICWCDDQVSVLNVSACLSGPQTDLCLLTLFPQRDGDEIQHNASIALDLKFPEVGEEIWSLGFNLLPPIADDSNPNTRTKVPTRFNLKRGRISEISDQRLGITSGPSFRTTIPFSPGDSGRMIGRPETHGERISLIGLVSSDMSTASSESNTEESGFSTASNVWPSVGFFMGSNIMPERIKKLVTVKDLIQHGAIGEVSKTIDKFDVSVNGKEVLIGVRD